MNRRDSINPPLSAHQTFKRRKKSILGDFGRFHGCARTTVASYEIIRRNMPHPIQPSCISKVLKHLYKPLVKDTFLLMFIDYT
jgi:hypothetical protein